MADLGYAGELGNYAEYSGAPNQQVTLLKRLGMQLSTYNFPLLKLDVHPECAVSPNIADCASCFQLLWGLSTIVC